ncbi:MAG: excinuclease ABC subunit UvrB [Bacteroidales bacterium]|jgi:excinuclease ABC subunit B|nr:excinuclease ABC subunit UvrB [Bacteroidales bacterium]MDD3104805.1 excinuclease ABC subunit UvrB [Bacteroidales bacterium]MDD3548909.1 excinuclease ABC subunit UvrB [Bacteroidales bacterium]MDD4064659.1 excinuclease ABC subunit UvrB [Bacteroidales bacterium]MDD5283697.1 excinuclease ABC subunit UvrB [Bacteroidales bacterium]
MEFKLQAPYKPTGDQPQAIEQLATLFKEGTGAAVLLGVTGSGKTFTMANVVERLQRPTLVISHNKTLAAQLYSEFKSFFPENAVEYFVSYYDYYQPEAYLPVTDVYIEKDLSINDEIEKLRLSTSSALLSGRRDVLVVSSVSCLYGIGNPDDFHANTITLKTGQAQDFNQLLYKLVDALYSRNENEFKRGTFRVRGDVVDVYLAYDDIACRIAFWGDQIESIERFDPVTGGVLERIQGIAIYPASAFVTTKERKEKAIRHIQDDLNERVAYLKDVGKHLEANRLLQRVEFDIEMIREMGYCSGIENYSRYFDGRPPGTRPFCLLDYFADDFLTIIDESHVTLPQIRAMYGGDRSRKEVLIEYGFRLPAAADNRPLRFEEFDSVIGQRLYVSATPADYELERSGGLIVEQVVRPTGLLDPPVEVRKTEGQIDDLIEEIRERASKDQRVLVTTLTKRMAEELDKFLQKIQVRCTYIHSDVETLERIRILEEFQKGYYDVLIGVNLLREGLDLPQVSLVAILDADKEGFLRSERSLTQTAGRAARNVDGKVIMYADRITDSMARTIRETERRRNKQIQYNLENGITPTQIAVNVRDTLRQGNIYREQRDSMSLVAEDPVTRSMTPQQLEKAIATARQRMEDAASKLDFITAAGFRDEMYALEKLRK